MLQLRSYLRPADNSGAKVLMVMHIYKGSKHKSANIGDTVLAVVKEATPTGLIKKKEKVRVVIVRTRKEFHRADGTHIRFSDNAGVIIDSQNNPRGTRIFGPIAREIKDLGFNKIASMAKEVY
ncbi:MAG: 50S ribosomal protein L14 [Candidatus Shapirobacteria bacterium]|nr:50S ribosomal protein L14 [Candidatus Shapirobacteria bacterium]